jgi:hypothetical protein
MPTNLLLIPLLGGFWLLHRTHYTRFRAQTLDGNRLLIESALVAAALVAIARLITFGIYFTSFGQYANQLWTDVGLQMPFSGTAVIALLIGAIAPYLLNVFVPQDRAKRWAIDKFGNDLLKLLNDALVRGKLVSISLDNRKVYIGLVSVAPNLSADGSHLTLIPFLSGYRDSDTLEMRFTTDYLSTTREHGLDLADFRVTMPLSSVRTASNFNLDAYTHFNIESDPAETDGTEGADRH